MGLNKMKFFVYLALAALATQEGNQANAVVLKKKFINGLAQITGDDADPADNEAVKAKKEATAEAKAMSKESADERDERRADEAKKGKENKEKTDKEKEV